MDHRRIEALMAGIAPVIREFTAKAVDKAVEPLLSRLKAAEDRVPERGADGPPGERGADGAPGRDGIDGKDGAPGPQGERGEKGDPGPDGAAGRDGVDGKDAPPVTREQLLEALQADPTLIQDAVAAWLVVNPAPAGKDGAPGAPGEAGADGAAGLDGKDGAPGRDGQPGVPGRDGKDGAPGKDGADGLGLEDFTLSSEDGGRTLVLSFQRGDVALRRELVTDIVLDRGVWKEGTYRKGDGVTWAGSFHIAQRDTDLKPEGPDSGWRLAVKRGRDGKDGKAGERGERGPQGTPGLNGRQA